MRKLATAAFSFAAAMFFSKYLLPYSWLPVFFAATAAFSFIGLLFKGYVRLRIFIILLSLSSGFIWSWSYTALFIKPSWGFHDETATVTATVKDYPSTTARGYRVDCTIKQDASPSVGARLYYYNEISLDPGDIVEFTALFRSTDGSADSERIDALSSRGAFLTGYVSGDIKVLGAEGHFRYFPKRLSGSIADMIGRLFPENNSPFMKALLTGKRDDLYRDSALNAALSASGVSHVVSISGMHVSFLMGFLALIVKNKRRFAITGIPVLLIFMAMTGFTPSVTRAGIMHFFLIFAPIFKRERDGVTSLSASLLILLILNPYSCASVSLQLSFSATLGIILFTNKINSGVKYALRGTKPYRNKLVRLVINFVTSNLATTIGALIFSIPLMVLHFGYVSLISPLTNLLTLWAVSLAFPLGLAACILGFIFFPLGTLIAFPVSLIVQYISGVSHILAAIPYSVVYSSNTPLMFWLAYIYVMFITLPLIRARARQYLYPACIAAVLLCAILLITPLFPSSANGAVTVLDVGQGQSIVLSTDEHTAVVDCGSSSGEDAAVIVHEFLQNQGRTTIDLLILTHFHSDHVNGVESLLSRTNVLSLAIPDPEDSFLAEDIIELARKRGTDIIYVTETYGVSLNGMEIIIYPPVGYGDENESGLTILSLGDVSALITGDMNSFGERSLLRFADLPEVDILVIGHHGSRFSTSEELLAAVAPNLAIISVGRNSYGHPSGETLERLDLYGVPVFRTDVMGHVTAGG